MYYKGEFEPVDDYESSSLGQKAMLQEAKKIDRGYNKIWRMVPRDDEELTRKRKKIEFYTSSDIGNKIRDAETGNYFNDKVGSANEDLYFKVGLATGECRSANGSSTLFFTSPYRYMTHMHTILPPNLIKQWEEKRDARIREIGRESKKQQLSASSVIVH
jgi:hypothetical protein